MAFLAALGGAGGAGAAGAATGGAGAMGTLGSILGGIETINQLDQSLNGTGKGPSQKQLQDLGKLFKPTTVKTPELTSGASSLDKNYTQLPASNLLQDLSKYERRIA